MGQVKSRGKGQGKRVKSGSEKQTRKTEPKPAGKAQPEADPFGQMDGVESSYLKRA